MDEDKVVLRIIRLEEDVSEIKEKLETLPTREEFLKGQDEIIGILDTLTTEMAASNHALHRHETRIGVLENKVGKLESKTL